MGFKLTILIPQILQRSWVQILLKSKFFFTIAQVVYITVTINHMFTVFWLFFSLRVYRYCGLWYSWDEQSSQTSSAYREQSKHIQSRINKSAVESVSDFLYTWVILHYFIFSVYSHWNDKKLALTRSNHAR